MKSIDDRANDEADRHARMMQKQRKTGSVSNVGPMIDWTTADYALKQSVAQIRQKDLKAVNHQTIDDEADRKQSVNQQFWHSMKEIIFMIVCAATVIYTLIHFAG